MEQISQGSPNSSPRKKKMTQDETLSLVQIKSIERDCLDRVFDMLSDLRIINLINLILTYSNNRKRSQF
jgi:hypothetical protein